MTGAHVVEVSSATFDADVVERSYEVPVLVDFWAAWCGPCRMLGPVLEEIAADMDGAFVLAKLDTDANPALAQQFGIRGIPACKLFSRGQVVAEFVGALPGGSVRRFLAENLPSAADDLHVAGEAKLAAGDLDGARADFEAVLADKPTHAAAHLALARLALRTGDVDAVQRHTDAIEPGTPQADRVAYLHEAAALHAECDAAGGLDAVRARIATDPKDLDARFALGCCHVAGERWDEALQALLEVVMRSPKHRDRAAHKAMLTVFGLLDRDDPRRDAYQRKLQIYT